MKVKLEILNGSHEGKVFEFSQSDRFLIGRSKEAHLMLDNSDRYVSRKHCLLDITPPNCKLLHISCTNPTEVNGDEVEEKVLKHGDIVTIGYTRIKIGIVIEDDPVPESPEGKTGSSEVSKRKGVAESGKVQTIKGRMPTVSQKAVAVACSVCGADLTQKANSDGRAAELQDKMTYRCPTCLPERQFMIGEKIGEYDLISKIGQGGMGIVYLVYHAKTARLLVLKMILDIAKSPKILRQFLREISVQKHLTHDYIIKYIDSNSHEDKPYLVMEYADGGNLEELIIRNNGPFSVEECIRLIIPVCEGLAYFHSLSPPVVHRDMKPSNVMLQKRKGAWIPKISDFGLAKPYNNAGASDVTQLGERKGTIPYMSLEQLMNTRDVDTRTDIFATGVILYYMLTGKYPFLIPTPLELNRLKQQFPHAGPAYYEGLKNMGYADYSPAKALHIKLNCNSENF